MYSTVIEQPYYYSFRSHDKWTKLCSLVVIVPESEYNELFSSAAIAPQSKSTELLFVIVLINYIVFQVISTQSTKLLGTKKKSLNFESTDPVQ